MCNCNSLCQFNYIPDDMRKYLRNYGYNISQKACEFAVSGMVRKGRNGDLARMLYPVARLFIA